MLLVKPPDRDTMLEVIAGLQSGELLRTEVVSWQMAVLNRFGNDLPLSVEDGLWYFYSFGFLDVPLVEGDSSTFFLRDMDFFEYQMDIEQVPANEVYEGVRRMRSHEANTSSGNEKFNLLWLSPDEWLIYSNDKKMTLDDQINLEDILFNEIYFWLGVFFLPCNIRYFRLFRIY